MPESHVRISAFPRFPVRLNVVATAPKSDELIDQHNEDPQAHPHLLDLIENVSTGGDIDGGTFN